jgi:tRNA threonylcarbamoyladenosine biosynthesis protein TsaB
VKPVILSLDTTHEFGSIAWLEGGEVVEEVLLHSPDGFGHVLFDHLERLLERRGRKLDEVACFAAASGPGSFTGVRVGLACVKGLAEALGRKVVTVSNLEALSRFGAAPQRAVALDARRGEIYGALYDAAGEVLREPVVTRFPAWLETLPDGEIEFVSTDFAPFLPALQGTRFENSKITTAPRALAGAVGRIAHERFLAGLARDPAEIDADYVRRSDAELFWKDR